MFKRAATFVAATSRGASYIFGATFGGGCSFGRATFWGASYVFGATFGGGCSFGRATFWGGAIFGWTLLSEIFKDLLNLPLLLGRGIHFRHSTVLGCCSIYTFYSAPWLLYLQLQLLDFFFFIIVIHKHYFILRYVHDLV